MRIQQLSRCLLTTPPMHFSSSEETGDVVVMAGMKRDNSRKRFEMQNQQAAFVRCLCCAEGRRESSRSGDQEI